MRSPWHTIRSHGPTDNPNLGWDEDEDVLADHIRYPFVGGPTR